MSLSLDWTQTWQFPTSASQSAGLTDVPHHAMRGTALCFAFNSLILIEFKPKKVKSSVKFRKIFIILPVNIPLQNQHALNRLLSLTSFLSLASRLCPGGPVSSSLLCPMIYASVLSLYSRLDCCTYTVSLKIGQIRSSKFIFLFQNCLRFFNAFGSPYIPDNSLTLSIKRPR